MRQYDICSLDGRRGGPVVILQHDLVNDLETCVVAPLVQRSQLPQLGRLRPLFVHAGQDWLIAVDRLATVRCRSLSRPTGSAADMDYEIKGALDLLFSGF